MFGGGQTFLNRAANHPVAWFYPVSLIEHGQMTVRELAVFIGFVHQAVSTGLLLTAVYFLARH